MKKYGKKIPRRKNKKKNGNIWVPSISHRYNRERERESQIERQTN